MKSSTKRVLSMMFAAIFLVGVLVVYGQFIRPALDEAQKKRSLVASKSEAFEKQRASVSQVENVIAQFQNLGQVRQMVALAIPEDPSVTDAFNQLYAIARTNGLSFQSLSFEKAAPKASEQFLVKRIGTVSVRSSLYGTYGGVKGFLEGLETNIRVSNISRAEIRPLEGSSTGSTEPLYTITIEVEMYYQEI